MQAEIRDTPNLTVIEGEADELLLDGPDQRIRLADGREFAVGAVVVTTGTFLRGLIHLGRQIGLRAGSGKRQPWACRGLLSAPALCWAVSRPERRRASMARPSIGPPWKCSPETIQSSRFRC
jgi:hypothetical protein